MSEEEITWDDLMLDYIQDDTIDECAKCEFPFSEIGDINKDVENKTQVEYYECSRCGRAMGTKTLHMVLKGDIYE